MCAVELAGCDQTGGSQKERGYRGPLPQKKAVAWDRLPCLPGPGLVCILWASRGSSTRAAEGVFFDSALGLSQRMSSSVEHQRGSAA